MARYTKFSKILFILTLCSKFTRVLTFLNFCKIPTLAAQSHALLAGAEDMGGDRSRLSQAVGVALDPDTGRMISRSVMQKPSETLLPASCFLLPASCFLLPFQHLPSLVSKALSTVGVCLMSLET
jgi:hypothetical protein